MERFPSAPDDAGTGPDANASADASDASAHPMSVFVATGYQNRRIVSLDGTSWGHEVSNPPDDAGLDDIGTGLAIGNGTIVVSGHTGIYTSRDGQSWNKLPPPVPQKWPGLGGSAAVFGDGLFVIVASGDAWTSTDGVTFTKRTPATNVSATHWNGAAFGNGHFFAVGDSNAAGGDRKVSEDGVAWHDYVTGGPSWRGAAFGAGVFVAVGDSGTRNWTADGVTVQDVSDASLGSIDGVAFGQGMFVVASHTTGKLSTSADGKSWTTTSSTIPGVQAFGGGLFLTTTWESNIWTSPQGTAWARVFAGDSGTPALARVAWGTIGN